MTPDHWELVENAIEPLDPAADGTPPIPQAASDHTEIEIGPAGVALGRCRPDVSIRIGTLAVPVSAAAWGLSLAIHAAAIAGIGLAAWYYHTPALPTWGGGGGASGGLLETPRTVVSAQPRLPDEESPMPAADSSVHLPLTNSDADSTPQWTQERTSADLIEPDFGSPMLGVGTPDTLAAVPRRRGSATGPGGIATQATGQPASNGVPSVASAAGSSSQYSGPGLPGALIGRGLPSPDYPLEARRRGQQGTVKIEIEVLPDGKLGQIRIASGPGYPLLRNAALAAAQKLRHYDFQPARYMGHPVRGALVVPYHFSLD